MGWDQLQDIIKENRRLADQEQQKRDDPVFCPVCGAVLDVAPANAAYLGGIKNCPLGHWRG